MIEKNLPRRVVRIELSVIDVVWLFLHVYGKSHCDPCPDTLMTAVTRAMDSLQKDLETDLTNLETKISQFEREIRATRENEE